MTFSELPTELIELILVLCDPIDVASVAQASSTFRAIIYYSEDSKLWRELYLTQPLDDPRTCVSQDGTPKCQPIDWRGDLQRIMRARTVALTDNETRLEAILSSGELMGVLLTFLDLMCYLPILVKRDSESLGRTTSLNAIWVTVTLYEFLDRVEGRELLFVERDLISQLHTYVGLTNQDHTAQSRVLCRAYVYTMRHYNAKNNYGPFLASGEVNWAHVRAIHEVVSMQLLDFMKESEVPDTAYAVFPMSCPFTQITEMEEKDESGIEDWAGITGPWTVSFCFCDHRELLRFNEANEVHVDNSLFESVFFREIFRSLDVKLRVKKSESDPFHPTRPILYFGGHMEDPSTSSMSGYVKMSDTDNQVQWFFISGDQGNAIWSSAGVQVGGLRSRFGVLGSWTTIFHDDDDPVGPFWLRKRMQNDLSMSGRES